jgi:phage/plasmid primase-like uncharacterized protein
MSDTASSAAERIYLAVPYDARDRAKDLGARWDREAKAWYVMDGMNTEAFAQWARRDNVPIIPTADDPREQFADELRRAGFRLSGGHPVMDGTIHRIQVDGDEPGERNGSYRGFLDGVPNGWHQNFKTTEKPRVWKADASRRLSTADRAEINASAATKRAEDAKQRDLAAEQAAQRAIEILSAASPAIGHAYLTAKEVRSEGLFIAAPGTTVETQGGKVIDIGGRLLVPIRDQGGVVVSLQIIDDGGNKMFLPGGKVGGGQHAVGKADSPWPLLVAEGYATAATLHAATGHAVVVAFNAHNLSAVAAQHRAARPERSIFIAGDNDHHLPLQRDPQGLPKRNVGLEAANAAAAAVDGHALIPAFQTGDSGSDWNDAMKQRGMAGIQSELAEGIARITRARIARDMAREKERRTHEMDIERERA